MKNKSFILLSMVALLSLVGCNNNSSDSSTSSVSKREPYKLVKKEGEKVTIKTKTGIPFLMQSAVLRTDLFINADNSEVSDLEDYFDLAKATSLNCIEIPFMWKEVETDYNTYDYSDIDTYLSFAKKYDIKINLLWYGSFTDGETHTNNLPSYITEDTSTYSLIQYCYPSSVFGDCVILDYADNDLLARESLAIKNLFNHIAEWNEENDYVDPILMVQIGAGLDRLSRWRINQYDIMVNGEIMSSDYAWNMVNKYVSSISSAVKNSNYVPITRVEFCEQQAVTNSVRNVFEIPTVDIVNTTYLHTVAQTKTGIKNFDDEFGEDIPIINTENFANNENYRIALATYALGGSGFAAYHLSSPLYYPMENNLGFLYRRKDLTATTLEEKFLDPYGRGQAYKELNEMLQKGYVAVARAKRSNFGLFGFDNLLSVGQTQKQYMTNGLMFDYTCSESSYGYIIKLNNYVYAISSKDATIKLSNCFVQTVSEGYFNEDSMWTKENEVETNNAQEYSLSAFKLYRFNVSNISSLPSLDELNNLGYKTILDSIRG
ncbi:MAG: hypothetical protein ACI31G_01460 [Bacilli bacterium]